MNIREVLEREVQAWDKLAEIGKIGHGRVPCLIQRYMLKHGDLCLMGAKRAPKALRGRPKECFKNAANVVLDNSYYDYIEGYAMRKDIAFPFLHAWVKWGEQVFDPTLADPENYEYLGVNIAENLLREQLFKNKIYGLFCLNDMVNVDLLRQLDPQLVKETLP